jgi:hypothetical protein
VAETAHGDLVVAAEDFWGEEEHPGVVYRVDGYCDDSPVPLEGRDRQLRQLKEDFERTERP